MKVTRRVILGSGSSGRKWLMEKEGLTFEVIVSQVDEPLGGFPDPDSFVQTVAWTKGRAVARLDLAGPAVIIAADTIGWLDGQPLLKPENENHAREMLGFMAGKVHELWTGVCLWLLPENLQVQWQEKSLVRLAPLTAREIDHYLETRIWRGCSGAYAVEGPKDPVVRVVEGSVSNVVGLPMETLKERLNALGFLSP